MTCVGERRYAYGASVSPLRQIRRGVLSDSSGCAHKTRPIGILLHKSMHKFSTVRGISDTVVERLGTRLRPASAGTKEKSIGDQNMTATLYDRTLPITRPYWFSPKCY